MIQVSKFCALAMLLLGGFFGFVCCTSDKSTGTLGADKPLEGYTTATVEQIVKDDRLGNQKVLFEGVVSQIGCADCGGVIIADKTWRISAEPEDPGKFQIPARAGTRLRIWGILRITDGFKEVKVHKVEFLKK